MGKNLGFLAIGILLLTSTTATASPHGHGHHGGYGHGHWDSECSPLLIFRTPAEVLEDHRAALAAQDWVAARCNYTRNAVVISDQGTTQGRDDIITDLQGLTALFGPVAPTVTSQVGVRNMVRLTFEIDLGWLTIPDGIDTYFFRRGKIHMQTAHGLAIISGPPPAPPAP